MRLMIARVKGVIVGRLESDNESKRRTHRAYEPYALCVRLFNGFRRLVLGAYCVVIGGIPAHDEGILGGSRDYTMTIYSHSTFSQTPLFRQR